MSNVENQVKAAMQAALDHLKSGAESPPHRTRQCSDPRQSTCGDLRISHAAQRPCQYQRAGSAADRRHPFRSIPISTRSAKAIEAANLGVNPMVDGKIVRINIPPMDETIRKQIAKQCKELGEKSKIALRDVRRNFNELVRKQKVDGIIPEDHDEKA